MTENKRYVRILDYSEKEVRIFDEHTQKNIFNIFFMGLDSAICLKGALEDTVDLLNYFYEEKKNLKEENEQLKADNNRLVNETAKVVAEHQGRVLDLIDEKIEELEGRYKFGQEVYRGCPMHNIRFGINVLKELKKELIE